MQEYRLGIDIGSTTVKIAILDQAKQLLFSDYRRHHADIQGTLADILEEAKETLGEIRLASVITGSGGLTLSKHMHVFFCQEVVAVTTVRIRTSPSSSAARTQKSYISRVGSTSA